jgi:hypothetical protein
MHSPECLSVSIMSPYSYEGAKMFPIIFGRPVFAGCLFSNKWKYGILVKGKEECFRLNACTKTRIAEEN